jgi:hypothetical protein
MHFHQLIIGFSQGEKQDLKTLPKLVFKHLEAQQMNKGVKAYKDRVPKPSIQDSQHITGSCIGCIGLALRIECFVSVHVNCNDRGPYHRTTAAKRMQRHFLAAELLYI